MKKSVKMVYDAKVEKTETGFSAYSAHFPVYTTGRNITELRMHLAEAYALYFEEESLEIDPAEIRLNMEVTQFFQYYKVLNARYLADRIGMNPTLLSQYVKARKKPSAKQMEKILKGLQEVGMELSNLNLTSK